MPHDGTTLALRADDADVLLNWLLAVASDVNERYDAGASYDFKQDQWGICQRSAESDEQYRKRPLQTRIWDQPDIGIWDLRPAGAAALNRAYPTVDSTFHFIGPPTTVTRIRSVPAICRGSA